MKYNVFESTNMGSTHYAERIYDAVATVDVENGTFGYLNGLATNEISVYNFVPGTAAGKQVVVADNPAWTADECRKTNQRRDQYIIEKGTKFRVRVVKLGDSFATAIEGVTAASKSAMAVGAYVTIDSTTGKLVAAASASSSSPVMEGKVESKRNMGATLVAGTGSDATTYGYSTELFKVHVEKLA